MVTSRMEEGGGRVLRGCGYFGAKLFVHDYLTAINNEESCLQDFLVILKRTRKKLCGIKKSSTHIYNQN